MHEGGQLKDWPQKLDKSSMMTSFCASYFVDFFVIIMKKRVVLLVNTIFIICAAQDDASL